MSADSYGPGPIPVEGAVFDDFRLTDHLPPDQAPGVIERDRLIMSARPGFNRKLLPLRVEPDTGTAYCGGRYLLDTYENAIAFADWCRDDFEIDGVLILERPDFADVSAHVFRVIGAHDFKDLSTRQIAYRTEIWDAARNFNEAKLEGGWSSLRDRAEEDGRSALWLMFNDETRQLAMVTVWDRVGEPQTDDLDFVTLRAVEAAPSYGAELEAAGGLTKSFDRSHWVFTIWFPNDDAARPSLWPNSPPLPSP